MQHISPERKYLLRRHLLRWAAPGAVYVPFVGDGDIAVGGNRDGGVLKHEEYRFPGLYTDRRIFAADLDQDRVEVAKARVTNGLVRVADCDTWPFEDVDTGPFAVADFDAWNEPYPSFRSFWEQAEKASRLVVIFTDAHRMGVAVDGTLIRPDGSKHTFEPGRDHVERSAAFNFYLSQIVWPWFEEFIRPYRVLDRMRYNRGMMTYWGAAIDSSKSTNGRVRSHSQTRQSFVSKDRKVRALQARPKDRVRRSKS